MREVDPRQMAGTLVLVPVINVPAYEAACRGNPLDTFSHDMNRIYPGRENGYLSERIAWAHAQWMRKVADLELSIHSGGAHSYLAEAIFVDERPESVELATAMGPGWGCIMSSPNPKGNPMAVMAEEGKVGITVELGGRSATSPKAFAEVGRKLADAVLNILRHYKMLPGKAKYDKNRTKGSQEALLAPASGLYLPEPGVDFLKPMKKDDVIARIVNLFGDELAVLRAPADGMIFGCARCPTSRSATGAASSTRSRVAAPEDPAPTRSAGTAGPSPARTKRARVMPLRSHMPDALDRDFVGYAGAPPHADWPNGARIALNFVLNYEEGSEYSLGDGDGRSETALTEVSAPRVPVGDRDLASESMYEYGTRVGFWRIARLFSEHQLPVTVFGCALALERNPPAAQFIASQRWDVCCHGWRWIEHYRLTEDEERQQIRMAVESLQRTIGERPLGWYCRYAPSTATRRLLVEEGGFLYDSDSYNDELPYWRTVAGRQHLVVPYSLVTNDVKLTAGLFTGDDFFVLLKNAFDVLYAEGARARR